ncbi:MAG: NTP transferase domain-containing protein [Acidimicrobiia bacterium]|nr:NTP transferase domain-containing protein [Acidimicrobiia bacterium]
MAAGTAAVVLAAGGGTRFVGPTHKLLAPLVDGRCIVEHAVGAAAAAGLDDVIVVRGAVELPAFGAEVTVVDNPAWAEGLASSVQAALAAAGAAGHGAVVVGLGDQPFVTPEAWRLVAAATSTPVAVATYAGQRGNPVRLARAVWARLPTSGDEGARSLLRGEPSLVTEVPCPGSAADIDTLEDLRTWS